MSRILSTMFTSTATPAPVQPGPARERTVHPQVVEIAGTGVHHFSTARVHCRTTAEDGVVVQRSTDVVTLEGDLIGTVLYHATARLDEQAGTAVVTGAQVFSGTVLGGAPTVLFDDRFRFDVDLRSGATRGEAHFEPSTKVRHAPRSWCDLVVTGTGPTPEGDRTFRYTGTCRR